MMPWASIVVQEHRVLRTPLSSLHLELNALRAPLQQQDIKSSHRSELLSTKFSTKIPLTIEDLNLYSQAWLSSRTSITIHFTSRQ
jgi:hypothetical protein